MNKLNQSLSVLAVATGILSLGSFFSVKAATIEFFSDELILANIQVPGGDTTTVNPDGFNDLIISGITTDPYGVSWSGFLPNTKVIANGEMAIGESGTLFPVSPPPGEVKIWGLPQEDIDIINNLPENLDERFLQTPEPTTIVGLLAISVLGLRLKRKKQS